MALADQNTATKSKLNLESELWFLNKLDIWKMKVCHNDVSDKICNYTQYQSSKQEESWKLDKFNLKVPFTILLPKETILFLGGTEVTSKNNTSDLLRKEKSLKKPKHYYTFSLHHRKAITKNHPADV